jgi:hypothetical protein
MCQCPICLVTMMTSMKKMKVRAKAQVRSMLLWVLATEEAQSPAVFYGLQITLKMSNWNQYHYLIPEQTRLSTPCSSHKVNWADKKNKGIVTVILVPLSERHVAHIFGIIHGTNGSFLWNKGYLWRTGEISHRTDSLSS